MPRVRRFGKDPSQEKLDYEERHPTVSGGCSREWIQKQSDQFQEMVMRWREERMEPTEGKQPIDGQLTSKEDLNALVELLVEESIPETIKNISDRLTRELSELSAGIDITEDADSIVLSAVRRFCENQLGRD